MRNSVPKVMCVALWAIFLVACGSISPASPDSAALTSTTVAMEAPPATATRMPTSEPTVAIEAPSATATRMPTSEPTATVAITNTPVTPSSVPAEEPVAAMEEASGCAMLEPVEPDSPKGQAIIADLLTDLAKDGRSNLELDSLGFIYQMPGWVTLSPFFKNADGVGELVMRLDTSGRYVMVAQASGMFIPIGAEEYRTLMLDQARDIPSTILDCLVAISPAASPPMLQGFVGDPASDVEPAHLDLTVASGVYVFGEFRINLYLREIPESLPYNSSELEAGVLEYAWTVRVYNRNDTSDTPVTTANSPSYEFFVGHRHDGRAEAVGPFETVLQAEASSYEKDVKIPYAAPKVEFDRASKTVRLILSIPELGKNSLVVVNTSDATVSSNNLEQIEFQLE